MSGRGGGRYFFRGGRRRGARMDYSSYTRDWQAEGASAIDDQPRQRRGGGRGRHPPGLKGKEIGLWYSRNSVPKKVMHQEVMVNEEKVKELTQLLEENKDQKFRFREDVEPPVAIKREEEDVYQIEEEFGGFEENEFFIPSLKEEDVLFLYKANPQLDSRLKQQNREKWASQSYVEMQDYRKKLPAFKMRQEILKTVEENQVVVICGETGCGKTTQVPQFILDDLIDSGHGTSCQIVCTQPRRISAITVAERVARERDEKCGGEAVGYHIRLESRLPRDKGGSIVYCTTGMVLKYLESDPSLTRVSHLVIDEIHERDLHSDFLLIISKSLISKRPNLRLILMSATLDAHKFATYFNRCPILTIPGFTHPVQEYYLEDVLEMTKFGGGNHMQQRKRKNFGANWRTKEGKEEEEKRLEYEQMKQTFLRTLQDKYSRQTIDALRCMNEEDEDEINLDLMKELVKHICLNHDEGAILVFLPGWEQISNLNKLLSEDRFYSRDRHLIIPLHSLMPTVNQREVFERPPRGVRKVILATNIAETSITIDDVVYVVDGGKIKMTNFDVGRNIATFAPQWVSLANAKQRKGRAGRVQPGVCYHMFTRLRESMMDKYLLPEMLRTRLEQLCLQIKMLKLGKIEAFVSQAMDPPSPEALRLAVNTLRTLNSLDAEENLTPLGYHLGRLPLDPHTGKMILFGAMFCCLDPILTVAASLDFKDAFVMPLGKEAEVDKQRKLIDNGIKSDHIMLARAFQGWEKARRGRGEHVYCRENFLSVSTLRMLEKMKQQLADHLYQIKFINSPNPKDRDANRNSENINLLRAVLCAGLYPKIAKLAIKADRNGQRNFKQRSARIATKEDGIVSIHPKSVLKDCAGSCESPWLLYHLKMKSSCVFLYDCTMVSAFPILFFGGNIVASNSSETSGRSDKDDRRGDIVVDGFAKFFCSETNAMVVQELRKELSDLLEYKISHPGSTDWDEGKWEGRLLKAIVELLTTERVSLTTD